MFKESDSSNRQKLDGCFLDLVYFTTRVPDTNDASATQTTRGLHERHQCDTSEKFLFW